MKHLKCEDSRSLLEIYFEMILWFRDGAAEDDSGILGILNRLEKDRNLSLGTSNGHQIKGSSENGDHFGNYIGEQLLCFFAL